MYNLVTDITAARYKHPGTYLQVINYLRIMSVARSEWPRRNGQDRKDGVGRGSSEISGAIPAYALNELKGGKNEKI